MLEEVEKKVKDLVAECHERGLVVFIGVSEKESGKCAHAMDGQCADLLATMSTGIVRMAEQAHNTDPQELVRFIRDSIKGWQKDQTKKGKK